MLVIRAREGKQGKMLVDLGRKITNGAGDQSKARETRKDVDLGRKITNRAGDQSKGRETRKDVDLGRKITKKQRRALWLLYKRQQYSEHNGVLTSLRSSSNKIILLLLTLSQVNVTFHCAKLQTAS